MVTGYPGTEEAFTMLLCMRCHGRGWQWLVVVASNADFLEVEYHSNSLAI